MTNDTPLPGMIGEHPSMRQAYALVRKAAPTDLTIAIVGETGTGKELVARAVHQLSARRERPMVDINCAAIPENLVESELFGCERGAHSTAYRTVPGLMELAHRGTLFLDEAWALATSVQAKLLRAIEQRRFRRVGGRVDVQAEFRMVLAFSRPPEELEVAGLYLSAFVHRISGATVHLPPLASRGGDVRRLAEAFLAAASATVGRPLRWSEEALGQLSTMRWPGNVRELLGLVERIPLHVEHEIVQLEHVLAASARRSPEALGTEVLRAVLERHAGNYSRAAAELGMPRSTLRDRLLRVPAD